MTTIRYNITKNEGVRTSVTVFLGADPLVATNDHHNFDAICDALTGGTVDPVEIKGLFDPATAINTAFSRLSERVIVRGAKLYFDGDPMDDGLAQLIVRFHFDGNNDFQPLVNFLEKLMTNPLQHSRENLFRWLRNKKVAIAPDGDFIAYKGIGNDGLSKTSGTAMVNGAVITGKIPNLADTIIEMPRSKVQHNPQQGCSTGLHAGNWRYAAGFGPRVVRVKINPRDVVSVPTERYDEKLRTCRYRVLDVVKSEDKEALFIPGPEKIAKLKTVGAETDVTATKPEPKPKPKPKPSRSTKPEPEPKEIEWPEYYHDFKRTHWEACKVTELRWIAKEWAITGVSKMPRPDLIETLIKAAAKQRRAFRAAQNK